MMPVQEVPTGAIDGSNRLFVLTYLPITPQSLLVFVNGVLQKQGDNYTPAGMNVTFSPLSTPRERGRIWSSTTGGKTRWTLLKSMHSIRSRIFLLAAECCLIPTRVPARSVGRYFTSIVPVDFSLTGRCTCKRCWHHSRNRVLSARLEGSKLPATWPLPILALLAQHRVGAAKLSVHHPERLLGVLQ